MKILLVNQYFWPDIAATAQLLGDLAEDLQRRGHDVAVITGAGSYARIGTGSLPKRQRRKGVLIRRVPATDFGRNSRVGRLIDYLSFLFFAAWALLSWRWARQKSVRSGCGHKSDGRPVVVCLSTPPFLAALGLLAKMRGWRFVYKIEDLYPDVGIALGQLGRQSLLAGALRATAKLLARASDRTVVLDAAMKARALAQGATSVEVIPNWADGDAIQPDAQAGFEFRRAQGLDGRFVILYSGNMGLAHRFDAVLDAAEILGALEPRVLFLFVGGGLRSGEIRDACARRRNVRLLPYQARERLGSLYNAADLHLVTLRDEVAGMLVPSKYAAALAAGKPVLLVGGRGAELHKEIRDRRVGWVCEHDATDICSVIRGAVSSSEEACLASAERSRSLFEERYSRAAAASRWEQLLLAVC